MLSFHPTCRQLSGIGASGSFQLMDPFSPSPSILAGEAVEEGTFESSDDEKGERYIVRKTKSGRGGIPLTIIKKSRK